MPNAYKVSIDQCEQVQGPQGQKLRALITDETVPGAPFSWLDVYMPSGGVSVPHVHVNSPIAIRIVDGHAATLVGEELEPVLHDAHDIVYVPAGVPHCAVNLNPRHHVIGFEVRTDPKGNEDVVMRPDLEPAARDLAAELCAEFADKLISARITGRMPW